VIRATGLFCYIPGIGVRGQLVNSHRRRGIQQSRKHSELRRRRHSVAWSRSAGRLCSARMWYAWCRLHVDLLLPDRQRDCRCGPDCCHGDNSFLCHLCMPHTAVGATRWPWELKCRHLLGGVYSWLSLYGVWSGYFGITLDVNTIHGRDGLEI
jgi:hypothetical protein